MVLAATVWPIEIVPVVPLGGIEADAEMAEVGKEVAVGTSESIIDFALFNGPHPLINKDSKTITDTMMEPIRFAIMRFLVSPI